MAKKVLLTLTGTVDWSVGANWTGGTIPANTDDVYIEEGAANITGGLGQSAVALASLNIAQNFVGTLGTKASPLQIGAAAVNLGYTKGLGQPAGSTRLHLDLGSTTAATVNVFATASSAEDDTVMPLRIKAAHASSKIYVRGGLVSIADEPGETATLALVDVSDDQGQAFVVLGGLGNSLTVASLHVDGGQTHCFAGPTTIDCDAGLLRTEGAAAIGTVNTRGGEAVLNNSGGISTALNLYGGTTDFTQSNVPRTVAARNYKDRGFTLKWDKNIVTFTATSHDIEETVSLTFN